MNSKKSAFCVVIIVVILFGVTTTGCSVLNNEDKAIIEVPVITATENIDGTQAEALSFGYSWKDGDDGAVADGIPVWQGEYADENILMIDGEMGQNMITLSAEGLTSASYAIYLPDGTVYDDGTRSVVSSLSPRLWWSSNHSSMGIIAPFEPGEYFYELTLVWEKNELQVTYGIKLVMTGQRNSYDNALDVVWDHYNDALSASHKGTEVLPGLEHAGECYVFDVELQNGLVRVAVSKGQGSFFEYSNDLWISFLAASEWSNAVFTRVETPSGCLDFAVKHMDNPSLLAVSSIQYIPAWSIDSNDELVSFVKEALDAALLISEEQLNTLAYEADFFDNNLLVILHLSEPSGSIRHEITSISLSDGQMNIEIQRIIPEIRTDDEAVWLCVVEIPKDKACGSYIAYYG